MNMENLSENVTLKQACYSATAKKFGISNIPNELQIRAMVFLANRIIEPVIKHFGKTWWSSLFRSVILNSHKSIRGAKNSQHVKGQAVDLDHDIYGMSNSDLFYFIKDNLDFDQLIWEFGTSTEPDWVHVSYAETGNRKMVLRSVKEQEIKNGKPVLVTKYYQFAA